VDNVPEFDKISDPGESSAGPISRESSRTCHDEPERVPTSPSRNGAESRPFIKPPPSMTGTPIKPFGTDGPDAAAHFGDG
jgi:hypothetical protein